MTTRVVSAAVLIAVLVVAVWWLPPWATIALAALAAAAAGGELAHIASAVGAPIPGAVLASLAAVACLALPFGDSVGDGLVLPVLLAAVVAAGTIALASGPPAPSSVTRAALLFMAPLYVGLPLGVLAWLRRNPVSGPRWLILPIAIVGISDTAQYLAGRAFGRRKLAPAISPKKTVEGAIGGLVAAAVAGAWLGPICLYPPGTATFTAPTLVLGAGLGLVLGVAGMLGDLFESLLKRSAGLKDSSALIPGHGGVLDRIDSHLFAAPIYYLFLVHVFFRSVA